MAITDLLRPTGQHRAVDEVDRLRTENARLLEENTAADRTFAELHTWWQFAEKKAADAEKVVVCQDATIRDLRDQVAAMQGELREAQARLANATAVDVPAGERDIDPGDEPTQPIPTGEHWADPARTAAGPTVPVLTLHQAHDSHAA